MSISQADISAFYKYRDSFDAFALDFFGVETTHNVTTKTVDFVGPEEVIVARIVWNALFQQCKTIVVGCPTMALVRHWRQLVADALVDLPKYMVPICEGRRDEIDIGANGSKILFRICNENTGRGMAVSTWFVIEPPLIKEYYTFVQSAWPTIAAGKNTQYFTYSRGY